jgi:hypothetical protein
VSKNAANERTDTSISIHSSRYTYLKTVGVDATRQQICRGAWHYLVTPGAFLKLGDGSALF